MENLGVIWVFSVDMYGIIGECDVEGCVHELSRERGLLKPYRSESSRVDNG